MGHYLNIYGVPREKPDEKILLFDMSAGNDYWDLYSLFRDSIDPVYPSEYDTDVEEFKQTDKFTEVTSGGLQDILDELDKSITHTKRYLDALCRLKSNDPEQTAFEVVNQIEYLESLERQRHGVEFLKYIVEKCDDSWTGFSKIVCTAD